MIGEKDGSGDFSTWPRPTKEEINYESSLHRVDLESTPRTPRPASASWSSPLRECKFLGYDTVENFAFIRDYYADNPQELIDLTKKCGVELVNLYGHFTFDVEEASRIAKAQIDFCAAVGVKWYNCQNAGFGDDGPQRAPH